MNKTLKKHFLDPQNIGEITDAKFSSIVRSETCNDLIKMTASIVDDVIEDVKIKVFGCGYSIAGASFLTDLLKGKSIKGGMDFIDSELKTLTIDIPEKHHYCIFLSKVAFEKIYNEYNQGV